MKKLLLLVSLMFTSIMMSINCSRSCTMYYPNSTQYYTYSWSQSSGECQMPGSGYVNYSISGKLRGSTKVIFIDSGEVHVSGVVC